MLAAIAWKHTRSRLLLLAISRADGPKKAKKAALATAKIFRIVEFIPPLRRMRTPAQQSAVLAARHAHAARWHACASIQRLRSAWQAWQSALHKSRHSRPCALSFFRARAIKRARSALQKPAMQTIFCAAFKKFLKNFCKFFSFTAPLSSAPAPPCPGRSTRQASCQKTPLA